MCTLKSIVHTTPKNANLLIDITLRLYKLGLARYRRYLPSSKKSRNLFCCFKIKIWILKIKILFSCKTEKFALECH